MVWSTTLGRNFYSDVCIFPSKETAPTSIKEDGGTMPVHTLISTESGTEEATTEASTKMGYFGPNTEVAHTP